MDIFRKWLEELNQELQGISEEDRMEIFDSYEEQINAMIDEGKSNSEILAQIGLARDAGQAIRDSLGYESELSNQELNVGNKNSSKLTLSEGMPFIIRIVATIMGVLCIWLGLKFMIGSFLLIQLSFELFIFGLSLAILAINFGIFLMYMGYFWFKKCS